jgi:hypothetical protein
MYQLLFYAFNWNTDLFVKITFDIFTRFSRSSRDSQDLMLHTNKYPLHKNNSRTNEMQNNNLKPILILFKI